MKHNRNDDEPIIAERRWRKPPREDAQPLWRPVLALSAGLALTAFLAWWWTNRASSDGTSEFAESPASEIRPEVLPEERIEQTPLPPASDLESDIDIAQAPAPPAPSEPVAGAGQAQTRESVPDDPQNAVQAAVPVAVRFTSSDAQVQIELRGPLASSPAVIGKAGDVVSVAPGTYRVVASGNQLETFEQDVTFEAGRPLEYMVELCAERTHERASIAGQIVDERECASTAECESIFMVLSEQADQLVKDRGFRTQQCAKWRPNAVPDGRWTLGIECGGATLATTCRIEIGEGACTSTEPRRTVRGTACPRAELK